MISDAMKRLLRMTGRLGGTVLCSATLALSSCGVNSPDEAVWKDVSNFSWPTEIGTVMKYRTIETDTVEKEVAVEPGIPTLSEPYLADYYALGDTTHASPPMVYFRSTRDTLIARNDNLGAEIELLAPLEEGHKWYATTDSAWHAEIIERYAYRKIDGTTYKNFIAVKYRKHNDGIPESEEWIRFFAQDVGEILTIRNVYPSTNSSAQILPHQVERRELIRINGNRD